MHCQSENDKVVAVRPKAMMSNDLTNEYVQLEVMGDRPAQDNQIDPSSGLASSDQDLPYSESQICHSQNKGLWNSKFYHETSQ